MNYNPYLCKNKQNIMKKYDSYKECVIDTVDNQFTQFFTDDWSYRDIEFYMFDQYDINRDSVLDIRISSVKRYKLNK